LGGAERRGNLSRRDKKIGKAGRAKKNLEPIHVKIQSFGTRKKDVLPKRRKKINDRNSKKGKDAPVPLTRTRRERKKKKTIKRGQDGGGASRRESTGKREKISGAPWGGKARNSRLRRKKKAETIKNEMSKRRKKGERKMDFPPRP